MILYILEIKHSPCIHVYVFPCVPFTINFLFLSLGILLIAISLFIADLTSGCSSMYTSFTGSRMRVYFAPRPLL